MKSFAGFVAIAAIALFGVQSSVEANVIEPFGSYESGTVVIEADVDVPIDVVRIVRLVVDAVVAELLPIIIELLPVLLPLLQFVLRSLAPY